MPRSSPGRASLGVVAALAVALLAPPATSAAAAVPPASATSGSAAAATATTTTSLAPVAQPVTGAAGIAANAARIRAASPSQVFAGGPHVQADGVAAKAATQLAAAGRTSEAEAARTIARYPVAIWLGGWYDDAMLVRTIQRTLAAAERTGTTPVFVTYDIPGRDCGGYSGGGQVDAAAYLARNQLVASTLAGHRAVVVVEPDALGHLSNCPALAVSREATLAAAVTAFTAAGVPSYLDAGNENWVKPAVMAERLRAAGVDRARGFSTNVSNYYALAGERAYGDALSRLTGGARYVVDTSRNARGWLGTWCNAVGAGLGAPPAASDGATAFDAQLWIKTPGASDGPCNGGPAAGRWFPAYAVALVRDRA
ncbi:glycoside hydrolase family 6 protein [Frigoribacterium salinisoli]